MEEAQEKDMDSVVSFKSGKSLSITGRQNNICSQAEMINLLVSSNRYGYIFYATESDGLVIIPSTHIDRESRYLSKSSEDDDDDNPDENQNQVNNSIIRRSYIPGQVPNKNSSFIPYWISLNADESILAIILAQLDSNALIIILYDVVKLIQSADSTPLCPPIRFSKDDVGGTIHNFAWNPAIPNIFAYIDGHGSVSTYEFDQNSKRLKGLGKSDANNDNSSICWSPKGKQLVVATYDGALELYESTMKLKKKYASTTANLPFPPCISVLWLSTHQFLLGFSENNPDENTNDYSYFHISVTYDKDQPARIQIYNDLFFDAPSASPNINPQYFYVRLNEGKIILCGLSKSLKINVLGSNELQQDSLDIWTFADQFRATVKGSTNVTNQRPVLTGMAIGLNSTLSIAEGNKKLPPCPVLFLSNNEGLLQVYYFIHQNLPSICRPPEIIKQIQPLASQTAPSPQIQSFTSQQPANGLPFTNFASTPVNQPKENANSNAFNFNQQSTGNKINQPPLQTTNGSSINDLSKSMSMNNFNASTPTKITTANEQPSPSIPDNKKLLQMIEQFQSRLVSLSKPLSKLSEPSINLDKSLEHLTATLNNMTTSLQTSIQSIKSMTSEHIESMTKIENARHQIKLSQKENLYHLLKDRELDPWTQSRLDSIKTKYDQIKHDLNVLLQLTHTTIHDKSLSIDDDETENEDFLPELELSLNANETMRQRIQKRIRELSHKVSETENDLQILCSKLQPLSLNTDLSSSKNFDSTFTKTTMSSHRSFHSSDAQILSHLQATHPNVIQNRVPPAVAINLSSSTIEQKKQSTIEITKPVTPPVQPSTPKQTNSPSVESESFKNMLRIVQTSIDLFSGVTSPEQLQELSSTIAKSPLSSTQKSNITPTHKTPTIPKTSVNTKPVNNFQTPAKSLASPIPIISVTPATPATQALSSDSSLKLQPTKPITQTATDLSRSQTTGDNTIRSLLNNAVSPSSTIPANFSAQVQLTQATSLPTASITSIGQSPSPAAVISTPSSTRAPLGDFSSHSSTITTSVQSISPTTKPIMSTGFGSRPLLGNTGFNLTPTSSSSMPFGNIPTNTNTGSIFGGGGGGVAAVTTTTPTPSPFGGGFGTAPTTSAPSTSSFGPATPSTTSPFGGGFSTATTTSAPSTSSFGTATSSTTSPFSTTSTPSTGLFDASGPFGTPAATSAPSGGFGSTTTSTSTFGSGFSPATSAPISSPFGGGFGATSSASTGTVFGGFGSATSPASSTTTFGSRGFGISSTLPVTSTATSSTGTSLFGAGATPSAFGSGFSGFNTQSGLSGTSTGFSFGGFGSQPSDATATQQTFNSFGSPPAAAQPPSPFGSAMFGAAPQSPGFGTTSSSFGASSTQSASSPSFTAYRK